MAPLARDRRLPGALGRRCLPGASTCSRGEHRPRRQPLRGTLFAAERRRLPRRAPRARAASVQGTSSTPSCSEASVVQTTRSTSAAICALSIPTPPIDAPDPNTTAPSTARASASPTTSTSPRGHRRRRHLVYAARSRSRRLRALFHDLRFVCSPADLAPPPPSGASDGRHRPLLAAAGQAARLFRRPRLRLLLLVAPTKSAALASQHRCGRRRPCESIFLRHLRAEAGFATGRAGKVGDGEPSRAPPAQGGRRDA
jgi:hypothetical protein